MSKINKAQMHQRPTYETLVRDKILEPKDKIALPDRTATILRKTQQLTRYDDVEFLDLEKDNENIAKEQAQQATISAAAGNNPGGSLGQTRAEQPGPHQGHNFTQPPPAPPPSSDPFQFGSHGGQKQPPHAPLQTYATTGGPPPPPENGPKRAARKLAKRLMKKTTPGATTEIFDMTINDDMHDAGDDTAKVLAEHAKVGKGKKLGVARMVAQHLGSSSGADPTFVAALTEQSLQRKRGKTESVPMMQSSDTKPPPPPGAGAVPMSVSVENQQQQFPTPGVSMEVSADIGPPSYPGAGGKGIKKTPVRRDVKQTTTRGRSVRRKPRDEIMTVPRPASAPPVPAPPPQQPPPGPPGAPGKGVIQRNLKIAGEVARAVGAAVRRTKRAKSIPRTTDPTPKIEPAPEAPKMEPKRASSEARAKSKPRSRSREPLKPKTKEPPAQPPAKALEIIRIPPTPPPPPIRRARSSTPKPRSIEEPAAQALPAEKRLRIIGKQPRPSSAPSRPSKAPARPSEAPSRPSKAPARPSEAKATPTAAPAKPTAAKATPTAAPEQTDKRKAKPSKTPAKEKVPATQPKGKPSSSKEYKAPSSIPTKNIAEEVLRAAKDEEFNKEDAAKAEKIAKELETADAKDRKGLQAELKDIYKENYKALKRAKRNKISP